MKPHDEVVRLSIEWLRKADLNMLTVEKLQGDSGYRKIGLR